MIVNCLNFLCLVTCTFHKWLIISLRNMYTPFIAKVLIMSSLVKQIAWPQKDEIQCRHHKPPPVSLYIPLRSTLSAWLDFFHPPPRRCCTISCLVKRDACKLHRTVQDSSTSVGYSDVSFRYTLFAPLYKQLHSNPLLFLLPSKLYAHARCSL